MSPCGSAYWAGSEPSVTVVVWAAPEVSVHPTWTLSPGL